MYFGIRKVVTRRDETRLNVSHMSNSTERRARHVERARHVFRGIATGWAGLDMSTSLSLKVIPEIHANPEHKRLNLYTRALLLRRRLPCWNKHDSTRTTHCMCRVVLRCDVASQVEFGHHSNADYYTFAKQNKRTTYGCDRLVVN